MNTKIEVLQSDGITVKERIIRFFCQSNIIIRGEAEKLYEAAEDMGLRCGTDMFDAAITLICEQLALNVDALAREIREHTLINGDPNDAHEDAIDKLGDI